jgi:hypothetical protein
MADAPVVQADGESARKVRESANLLARAALREVDQELPWYGQLPKDDRAYVDSVARAGINSFVQWFANRDQPPSGLREMFDAAPVELTKTISLGQTLELMRVIVAALEHQSDAISVKGQEREVREAALQFSRDVAFSAAEVYAQAAELRGAWDARIQAQALEALIDNETPEKLIANFRALSWNTKAPVTVLVGAPPVDFSEAAMITLRRKLQSLPGNALVGLRGDQLVLIYCAASDDDGRANRTRKPLFGTRTAAGAAKTSASGGKTPVGSTKTPAATANAVVTRFNSGFAKSAGAASGGKGSGTMLTGSANGLPKLPNELLSLFGPGPLVIGPPAPSIIEAAKSVQAALSAWQAARGWAAAPRPVMASDLLPERALLGDTVARDALVNEVYQPIRDGKNLLETLTAYLEHGRSLEAAARELDIHANTARYRLNNIAELTGWDPFNPREAYVLQIALTLGALANS